MSALIGIGDDESYPLHECVFSGDVQKLASLLRFYNVTQKDKHGNTALHLAVMLGHKECVQLLLAHGAPVKVRNFAGWSPVAEAVSYGDRQTILSLVRKLKQQSREQMEVRKADLIRRFRNIQDFYMELKWDFHSWIPLVSRVLPSDVCKIYKSGGCIRLDTTILDFKNMKWERDVSFIFQGGKPPRESLTVLDNKSKVYQYFKYEETETELEEVVDLLMSSDIVAGQMSTKSISFARAQSGWIFRGDKKETVAGLYKSDIYTITGLVFKHRQRREHLSTDDLQKNNAVIEGLKKGNIHSLKANEETQRRESLNPPPASGVDWITYISAKAGQYPGLGRKLVYRESSRNFNATVAMSDDFPLSVDMLLNILEAVAPIKHFVKLRQFVTMKLPKGFPVKLDIPVFPTVTAVITFQKFEFKANIPPDLFNIPSDYTEDPHRFSDF